MNQRFATMTLLGALAIVVLAAPTRAHAQDSAERLRQQNEQLEAKVADLESALQAAMAKIAALEAQLAANGVSTPQTSSAKTQPDSTITTDGMDLRTPVHVEASIREAYRSDYASSGLPEFASADWVESESVYNRWLQKWIAGTDRKFRKPISWPVVMERSFKANSTESIATLVAWDAQNNTQIGHPFQVRIPTRTLERIYRAQRIAGGTVELVLDGVYVPHLQYNRNRIDRGPFDNPPFIGPKVELRWSVDVKSLSPVKEEEESPEKQEKTGSS